MNYRTVTQLGQAGLSTVQKTTWQGDLKQLFVP